MDLEKYIVITRPLAESQTFQKQLEGLGYKIFLYPSIAISKPHMTQEIIKHLQDIASFDWIVFTSRNGVSFFMEAVQELDIDVSILQTKRIAAVGPKTAEEAKKYHLSVNFIPSEFTTADLAQQLIDIKDKKILLPRANIASPILSDILQQKGALVTNIPIYTTEFTRTPSKTFEELLKKKQIRCITFTSPSTVKGFLKNIERISGQTDIFSLPVISIGPVTTNSLKHYGFQNIYTADTFTIEGMVSKLKESIL